ncbi:hypothetical protein [Acaryochloris sp. IP29b_bin.137]|uniref:hypothetical protein n=1 Tax=Acaryochloris sp. IP29b_bin.137 TaxID=2969217 RepID=UPI00263598F8|nr:hypothetical protein [Acaryochloris sp. IP29b_bin.137]
MKKPQRPTFASIRNRYVELAQAAHQDLGFHCLGATYDEYYSIVSLYPDMGPTLDQGVLAEALLQEEPPERACALIAQSPYVQSQLHAHQQDFQVMSAYGMPLINTYTQVYRSHHGYAA